MSKRRPALTCSRCRERKVLCDRRKPCFACIRSKKPHLCAYDASSELKQMKGDSSFHIFKLPDDSDSILLDNSLSDIILKLNGKNLFYSRQEKINFYERFTPSLSDEPIEIEYGPLAWPFIEKKEPALHMMLKYIRESKMTNDMDLTILGFFQILELKTTANEISEYHDEIANTLHLKIKTILPSKKIIWNLISLFFKHVYSFMPILDEISFRMEMTRIIGPEEFGDDTIIPSIQKDDDFAYIGILLIILRTCYLQDDKGNGSCISDGVQIGPEYINLANMCLRRYDIIGKVSLTVLQCAFCLRLYQKVAPTFNDSFNNKNTTVYNGILVQMAYSLGLNKDIQLPDQRMKNLRQKIWHLLVLFDIIEAYSFGSPLITKRLYFNTRLILPGEIDGNNSNNLDCTLERSVVSNMINLLNNMDPLIDILNMILDIKGQTKISSLVLSINKVEIRIAKSLGFLKDILVPIPKNISALEIHDRIHKMKALMSIKIYLSSIYQHLAVHFEHTNNVRLALFYRKKIQCISIGEIMPVLLPLTEDMSNYFGRIGVLIITSFFFQSIYRMSLLNIEVLIRLRYHFYYFTDIYSYKQDNSYIYSYLSKAIEKLERSMDIFISCISRLCKEYDYTKKPKNLLNVYLCILKKNEFYEGNMNNNALRKTEYTSDYLKQMCCIYDAALGNVTNSPYPLDSVDTYDFEDDTSQEDIFSLIDFETLNFDIIDYINQFGNDNFVREETSLFK